MAPTTRSTGHETPPPKETKGCEADTVKKKNPDSSILMTNELATILYGRCLRISRLPILVP